MVHQRIHMPVVTEQLHLIKTAPIQDESITGRFIVMETSVDCIFTPIDVRVLPADVSDQSIDRSSLPLVVAPELNRWATP